MLPSGTRRETAAQLEECIHVNSLGPHLLTQLMIPTLSRSQPARVVTVSSTMYVYGVKVWDKVKDHDFQIPATESYSSFGAYGVSKLLNVLDAIEFNRQFKQSGLDILTFSLHPGGCVKLPGIARVR